MFKVWIDVEELDADGDPIDSSCWPGPACAEFETVEEANRYADRLFEVSQTLKELASELRSLLTQDAKSNNRE